VIDYFLVAQHSPLLNVNKVKKIRVNISLEKSVSIGYRLKIEMATEQVYLHFEIN